MASLVPIDGVLFNSSGVAPSPCKDFWQLIVTVEKVLERLINLIRHIFEGLACNVPLQRYRPAIPRGRHSEGPSFRGSLAS